MEGVSAKISHKRLRKRQVLLRVLFIFLGAMLVSVALEIF